MKMQLQEAQPSQAVKENLDQLLGELTSYLGRNRMKFDAKHEVLMVSEFEVKRLIEKVQSIHESLGLTQGE